MGDYGVNSPMATVVIEDAGFSTLMKLSHGKLSQIASSMSDVNGSIFFEMWKVDDIENNKVVLRTEADEVKYIISGDSLWRDLVSGRDFQVKAGSVLCLPKDSQTIRVQSRNLSAFRISHSQQGVVTNPKPETKWLDSLSDLYKNRFTLYVQRNQESRRQFDEALQHLPGGNTRTVLHYDPFPMVFVSGRDCYVTSKDGQEYLDCVSEYSAALFGHSHPVIMDAVHTAMGNGINLGGPGSYEVELARLIKSRFRSIEKLRFCNSGSEANTMALAIATIFTQKRKVMVFENSYHGGFISFGSGPSPTNIPHEFIVSRFNDIDCTRKMLSEDIAAIIVEPMQGAGGMNPATKDFLQFLRDSATNINALLIFDEVVTSRLHINGLQGYFNVYPDLTVLGKYIGGGSSFGAFGGRSDVMDKFDPRAGITHSGTYNNNVYTMAAGIAGCKILTEPKISALNYLGDKLRDGVNAITQLYKVQHMKATGLGSMIGIHFDGPSAPQLRDAFFFDMLAHGIYVGKRGFLALNLLHEEKHIDLVLKAVGHFIAEVFSEK